MAEKEEDKFEEFKGLKTKERRRRLTTIFVKEGTMEGHSNRELGRLFGVSHLTIGNDKKKISEKIAHIPNKLIAMEYNLNKIKGVTELLKIINEEGSRNMDKINAINSLMNIAEKEISWRYKLGLIDIEPPVVKIEQEAKISMLQIIKIMEETQDEGERIVKVRDLVVQSGGF